MNALRKMLTGAAFVALALGGAGYATAQTKPDNGASVQEVPCPEGCCPNSCTAQDPNAGKPKGPVKPNCADMFPDAQGNGQGMCLQVTVANSVGATESVEGYCAGKSPNNRCYNTAEIPNLAEQLAAQGVDIAAVKAESKQTVERVGKLEVRVGDLEKKVDSFTVMDTETLFAIERMKGECRDEYNAILKAKDEVLAVEKDSNAARTELLAYVTKNCNVQTKTEYNDKQLIALDFVTGDVPKSCNADEAMRLQAKVAVQEELYTQKLGEMNALLLDVRTNGCIEHPESKGYKVIPRVGIAYGTTTDLKTDWLEGEIALEFPFADNFSIEVGGSAYLPIETLEGKRSSRKTVTDRILNGMADQTTVSNKVTSPYGTFGVGVNWMPLEWLGLYAQIEAEAGEKSADQAITVNGQTITSSESTPYFQATGRVGTRLCLGPVCAFGEYGVSQDGTQQGVGGLEYRFK